MDRFVMQLLNDVIYFVANREDTGGDPLDIIVTKPDRERPKLLREQNVLKQVRVCVRARACACVYAREFTTLF
jgi:hypothetical protein